MLLASAQLADKLGVNAAPTAFIDGKQIDGVPTFPELLKKVCDAYTGTKPAGCTNALVEEADENNAALENRCQI